MKGPWESSFGSKENNCSSRKKRKCSDKASCTESKKNDCSSKRKKCRSRARSLGNCKNKETLDSLLHLTFKNNLFFGARSSGEFERKWKGFWNQALEVRKNNSSSRKKKCRDKASCPESKKNDCSNRRKKCRSRARSLGNCKNKKTLGSLLHLKFKNNLCFGIGLLKI